MFIYLCCMFHKYGNFHMYSTEDIWDNKIYMYVPPDSNTVQV